jgi:hypothetical protein
VAALVLVSACTTQGVPPVLELPGIVSASRGSGAGDFEAACRGTRIGTYWGYDPEKTSEVLDEACVFTFVTLRQPGLEALATHCPAGHPTLIAHDGWGSPLVGCVNPNATPRPRQWYGPDKGGYW